MKQFSKTTVFLVCAIFIFSLTSFAQENNILNNKKHRIGFIVGYGAQDYDQFLNILGQTSADNIRQNLLDKGIDPTKIGIGVKYDYQVRFFQAQYYYSFLRRKNWGLDLLVQPQYNSTVYKHKDLISDETNGFEFGVNVGVLIRKNIYKDYLNFYTLLSLGPHYVKGTPERQIEGFIFSDNIFIGLNVKLYKNLYLDIRPGFRHISNASLAQPNGGLNTVILSGGIMLNL